ncbi:ABC transporter permease (plasmid) [Rhizobium sp. RCAM05350]|nr:ABC transporter permease [Rhizobium sp. RCAM05350]
MSVLEQPQSRRIAIRRGKFAIKRLCVGLLMLMIVSGLIFCATQALPGDITTMILGKDATPEQIAAVRSQLHLDQPLIMQYGAWLGNTLSGDFGRSIAARMPVAELIGPRIVNSFTLVIISMAFAVPVSVACGLATAFFKDGLFDRGLLGFSLGVNALPEFVLGLLLVVLFSTNVLHLLPAVSILSPNKSILAQAPALVLPVLTLFLLQTTYLYRLVRARSLTFSRRTISSLRN